MHRTLKILNSQRSRISNDGHLIGVRTSTFPNLTVFSKIKLLNTLNEPSVLFLMKRFRIHGLADVVQQFGKQDHFAKPQWTFSPGILAGICVSHFCAQIIPT